MIITFYEETHRIGDTHYHMDVTHQRCGGNQKKVFMRLKQKLGELLPEEFHVKTYSSKNDIGILDLRGRQHAHLRYAQQPPCFPSSPYKVHNFHLDFMRPEFKQTFHRMLQECFPKATIEWIEDAQDAASEPDARKAFREVDTATAETCSSKSEVPLGVVSFLPSGKPVPNPLSYQPKEEALYARIHHCPLIAVGIAALIAETP